MQGTTEEQKRAKRQRSELLLFPLSIYQFNKNLLHLNEA